MSRFVTMTAVFLSLLVVAGGAAAQGTLRIGMTASDVPYTGGQSDNGFEGFRFVGYQVYEPLIAWDLTRGDRLPPLVPGLAESWEVRKDQPTKWVSKLRRDVKFHDGSPFNADAVVFSFESIKKKDAPHYDSYGSGQVTFRLASLKAIRKIDDHTVEFETDKPDELRALPGRLHGDRVTDAVAEVQGLAEVRRAAVGDGAIPGDEAGAARASRARGEQELLGPQAPAEGRQADPLPDAGANDAARGAQERAGGLDRGAAARRDPPAQGGGLPDHAELVSAQLDAHAAARQGAVEQQARAQGRQLRHRSGRHLQEPPERHVHPGDGRRVQGPPVVRRPEGDLHVRPGQGQGAAQAGGLR